jgi:Uncharacterized protein conserved in bacteria, prophage-related
MGNWKDHLQRAIGHLGSQPKLADAMKRVGAETCSQSKISWLLQHGKTISAEDALAIDRATEGAVSASELRPDLWPSPELVPQMPAERASA